MTDSPTHTHEEGEDILETLAKHVGQTHADAEKVAAMGVSVDANTEGVKTNTADILTNADDVASVTETVGLLADLVDINSSVPYATVETMRQANKALLALTTLVQTNQVQATWMADRVQSVRLQMLALWALVNLLVIALLVVVLTR